MVPRARHDDGRHRPRRRRGRRVRDAIGARAQALGVGSALIVAGCAGGGTTTAQVCTDLECTDRVTFATASIIEPLAPGRRLLATACLDGDCTTVEIKRVPAAGGGCITGSVELLCHEHEVFLQRDLDGGEHTVSLRIEDERGDVLVDLRETRVALEQIRPNGPDCEPVCWQARVALVQPSSTDAASAGSPR